MVSLKSSTGSYLNYSFIHVSFYGVKAILTIFIKIQTIYYFKRLLTAMGFYKVKTITSNSHKFR